MNLITRSIISSHEIEAYRSCIVSAIHTRKAQKKYEESDKLSNNLLKKLKNSINKSHKNSAEINSQLSALYSLLNDNEDSEEDIFVNEETSDYESDSPKQSTENYIEEEILSPSYAQAKHPYHKHHHIFPKDIQYNNLYRAAEPDPRKTAAPLTLTTAGTKYSIICK